MPVFSERSLARLRECHPDLQRLFLEVVEHFDCTVLCGYRSHADQQKAFDEGRSKALPGESAHNYIPALAIDVAPWPVDWKDVRRFYLFGGFVLGLARQMSIDIRWGGDWDQDTQVRDQRFNDLVHFEIHGWRKMR